MKRNIAIVLPVESKSSLQFLKQSIILLNEKYHLSIFIIVRNDQYEFTNYLPNQNFSLIEKKSIDTLGNYIKTHKIDVVCDFNSGVSASVFKIAQKVGIQLRFLVMSEFNNESYLLFNKFLKNKRITKVLVLNKNSNLKNIKNIGEYYQNINFLNLGDESTGLLNLDSFFEELDTPLRHMEFNLENGLIKRIWELTTRYNHTKYWKLRYKVVDDSSTNIWVKYFFLFRIKKLDAFHKSSFGTSINSGAKFLTMPNLPHGPNGIIIGHDSIIGKNVTIFHQVTIMHGGVIIGNNVIIGAGAKILPHVHVGNNVRIGANCVVVEDIPSNSTVVMNKPRIIIKDE